MFSDPMLEELQCTRLPLYKYYPFNYLLANIPQKIPIGEDNRPENHTRQDYETIQLEGEEKNQNEGIVGFKRKLKDGQLQEKKVC